MNNMNIRNSCSVGLYPSCIVHFLNYQHPCIGTNPRIMDTSTSTAFQLRLQWLEAILSNPESTIRQSLLYSRDSSQSKSLQDQDGREAGISGDGKDITSHTVDLFQQLRNAVLDSGHDSLRRLIDECEPQTAFRRGNNEPQGSQYAHLSVSKSDDSIAPVLFPITPLPPPNVHDESTTGKPSETRKTISSSDALEVNPVDLIPASTKLELVLGAADDLRDAERMLREIEVLVERGVDGSGDLACK